MWFCIISIHVLRVEDDKICTDGRLHDPISIHVLRVEDDVVAIICVE